MNSVSLGREETWRSPYAELSVEIVMPKFELKYFLGTAHSPIWLVHWLMRVLAENVSWNHRMSRKSLEEVGQGVCVISHIRCNSWVLIAEFYKVEVMGNFDINEFWWRMHFFTMGVFSSLATQPFEKWGRETASWCLKMIPLCLWFGVQGVAYRLSGFMSWLFLSLLSPENLLPKDCPIDLIW